MDAYPTEFTTHETPLLVLSGLGEPDTETPAYPLLAESGFQVFSEIPPVTTSAGLQLLECFLRVDASSGFWAGRSERAAKNPVFRIRAVGRVCRVSLPEDFLQVFEAAGIGGGWVLIVKPLEFYLAAS